MEALTEIVHHIGITIETMAVAIVAFGSLQAFIAVLRMVFAGTMDDQRRGVYVRYLQWLVAGLTFQLAADIVHTAIAPTWTQLGHVAAIGVIRTFLGYFLGRDIREARENP